MPWRRVTAPESRGPSVFALFGCGRRADSPTIRTAGPSGVADDLSISSEELSTPNETVVKQLCVILSHEILTAKKWVATGGC